MSVFTDTVSVITSVLRILTWRKLAQICAMLMIGIVSIGFWENRPVVYTSLSVGRFSDALIPIPLHAATTNTIREIVVRSPSIVAIQVVSTNFRENTRQGIYFYSSKNDLNIAFAEYQQQHVSQSPLFISGDAQTNDRIINIMEQELVCVDIPDRVKRLVPLTMKYAKQMCSISVPPRYGKMVGYVTLYMDHAPGRDELMEIKQIARTVSDEVYDRDVVKSLK